MGMTTTQTPLVTNRRTNPALPVVPRPQPAGATTVGSAQTRDQWTAKQNQNITPGPPIIPTVPPSVSALGSAAERMKRRAAAGSAGKVKTGPISLIQQAVQAVTTPRTLIGS